MVWKSALVIRRQTRAGIAFVDFLVAILPFDRHSTLSKVTQHRLLLKLFADCLKLASSKSFK